eukprot:1137945-Prymnesium_polylepis.1
MSSTRACAPPGGSVEQTRARGRNAVISWGCMCVRAVLEGRRVQTEWSRGKFRKTGSRVFNSRLGEEKAGTERRRARGSIAF